MKAKAAPSTSTFIAPNKIMNINNNLSIPFIYIIFIIYIVQTHLWNHISIAGVQQNREIQIIKMQNKAAKCKFKYHKLTGN